jgi:protein-tyrosine-phosphatase
LAQVIANDYFKRKKMEALAVSRGINVLAPCRASENAVAAARLISKLDLSNHISRQITEDDIKRAYVVLTMTDSQKEYLRLVYGEHEDKIFSLSAYAGANGDIADPFGMDVAVYKRCAGQIYDLITDAFKDEGGLELSE